MTAQLEDDFLHGRLDRLASRTCPVCGGGNLMFSVWKGAPDMQAPPGRRYQGSISIYCRADCNTMLTHLDGFIPAWAENIDDWEKFSDDLASGTIGSASLAGA